MKLEELLGELPQGWIDAFGQMLVDDINAIVPNSVVWEAKEKWGEMRLTLICGDYLNEDDADNSLRQIDYEEIDRVKENYSMLSRHICIGCGKPDVPIIDTGWVYPCCKECFEKHISEVKRYEDVKCERDNGRMCDSYVISKWCDDGYRKISIDTSRLAERIRKRWAERCAENDKD